MTRKLHTYADQAAIQDAPSEDVRRVWEGYRNGGAEHPDGWVLPLDCAGTRRRVLLSRSGKIAFLDPHTLEETAMMALTGKWCDCYDTRTKLVRQMATCGSIGSIFASCRGINHHIRRVVEEVRLGRTARGLDTQGCNFQSRFRRHVNQLVTEAWGLRKPPRDRPPVLRGYSVFVTMCISNIGFGRRVMSSMSPVKASISKVVKHLDIRLHASWANNILRRRMVRVTGTETLSAAFTVRRQPCIVLDASLIAEPCGGFRCVVLGRDQGRPTELTGIVRRVKRAWFFFPDPDPLPTDLDFIASHPRDYHLLRELHDGAELRWGPMVDDSHIGTLTVGSRFVRHVPGAVIDDFLDRGLVRSVERVTLDGILLSGWYLGLTDAGRELAEADRCFQ